MDAVVLLSGGMDSTTCLAIAHASGEHTEIHTVSFNYGQSHKRELVQARKIAEHYDVSHTVIEMPPVFAGSGRSSLMGEVEHPHQTYKEIEEGKGVSPTYVPYRNGNLLSTAAAFAMTVDANWLYTGVHAEDARSFAYPDCTPEFIGAQAAAIYIGTYHQVRLIAPLQYATKSDIVQRAMELEAPLDMTHSCYKGTDPSCGVCPTCVERIAAFRRLGLEDPIAYAPGIDQKDPRYETHHGGRGL